MDYTIIIFFDPTKQESSKDGAFYFGKRYLYLPKEEIALEEACLGKKANYKIVSDEKELDKIIEDMNKEIEPEVKTGIMNLYAPPYTVEREKRLKIFRHDKVDTENLQEDDISYLFYQIERKAQGLG